jgi:TonB family protein
MASRARELLRGITIPNVAPPPARPADQAAGGRRALADGAERDVPLRLYVDSVRQKLERTAVLGGAQFSLRDVRIDPLVSLSLRSDGSVDDVTIVRSSGRAEMDDAVRRFIRLNARYAAFPPNVAARFDVIEIRRVWRFADGLKLLEEMR